MCARWLSRTACIAIAIATSACPRPPSQQRPAPVVVDADAVPPALRPAGAAPDAPFFPGTSYDPEITAPEACLGHEVGARLAAPAAILGCFRAWAEQSPRVRIEPYARSHEGRDLVRVIVTSPANHARLDDILGDLGALADPRGADPAALERIVRESPAVGWFGYSIHGDETSGADAAVAFGHHLIAALDAGVPALLEQIVVVIDPVMNPDGRARILSQIEQSASLVPNLDDTSMHRGRWPWGRGNHYLFDMNRDWIAGVAPETRGRWQGIQRFHPQLVIDAHEMGARDTYLFYPYADPVNPHFAPTLAKWQRVFATDHSRAFDRHGWAYYTREWADGWFPGYTDAWGALTGAVGILYEQARTGGQPLLRPSGQRVTYRESVHAQAVSSLANLGTLARNREAILGDYLAHSRRWLQPGADARVFALRPGSTPDRERRLLRTLMRQGIEVYRAGEAFTARAVRTSMGARRDELRLPAGTYLVPAAQPRGALVRAALELDTRFSSAFLAEERAELERRGASKVYDVTAWNLGQSFGLDAYWIDEPGVSRSQVTAIDEPPAGLGDAQGAPYAWIVNGRDDASLRFAVQALERGITVHVADRGFESAGRSFPRGSLLVRAGDNEPDVAARLAEAAADAGVRAIPTDTGRAPGDGPDLGGRHFRLLHRPRVGVLTNAPVRPSDFGHIWHLIDRELRMPMSLLDIQYLGAYDLRRYTVLVIPPAGRHLRALLAAQASRLRAWVRGGGTLVAAGSSAAVVASEKLGLSQVRRRRDVLTELPLYRAATERALAARDIAVDEAAVWDGARTGSEEDTGGTADGATGARRPGQGSAPGKPEALRAEEDAWMRRFSPRGVMLRALVDTDAWLTFGVGAAEMPVLVLGDHALLARAPVRAPVRLAPAARLRLSGLLWPEARARLALSAYATVERAGAGQIILFASPPSFRGSTPATARLLGNALVYGPSLGASQPLDW